MYKAILVHTDVDEATELRDVRHDARQNHTHLQVFQLVHIVVELEGFRLSTRVAARLLQLAHDVGERWHAHLRSDIALQVDTFLALLVLDQLADGTAGVLSHLFHQGVALGVHGRVVQRVLGIGYAQESRTLLVGRWTESCHFLQLRSRCESPIFATVVHDVLRQRRSQSADVGQQMLRRSVQVHAHQIHATLHGLVEALLQFSLIHVVLILSYADALWIYLHQLGQRVHQTATNRHGTAYGDVLVGKLVAGNL